MSSRLKVKYGGEIRTSKICEEQVLQVQQMLELTDHQLNEIYECFNSIDIDGSGSISSIELHKTINLFKNNISLKDAEEIIEDIDTDNKGVIDFVDFIKIVGKEFKEPLKEEDAQNVFNILNSNTTGFVTSSELYPLLTSFGFELTPTEIDATFKKYGDGLLDYTEIKKLVQQAHSSIIGPDIIGLEKIFKEEIKLDD